METYGSTGEKIVLVEAAVLLAHLLVSHTSAHCLAFCAGRSGFELMDLGMHIPYKESLGAELLPRAAFLKRFRRLRDQIAAPLDVTLQECSSALAVASRQPKTLPAGSGAGKRIDMGPPSEKVSGSPVSIEDKTAPFTTPHGFVGCRELFQLLGTSQRGVEVTGGKPEDRSKQGQGQPSLPMKREG